MDLAALRQLLFLRKLERPPRPLDDWQHAGGVRRRPVARAVHLEAMRKRVVAVSATLLLGTLFNHVIEVYRGDVPAERRLGIFATYKAFFPQLVAGAKRAACKTDSAAQAPMYTAEASAGDSAFGFSCAAVPATPTTSLRMMRSSWVPSVACSPQSMVSFFRRESLPPQQGGSCAP
jgi:hypothetical protein